VILPAGVNADATATVLRALEIKSSSTVAVASAVTAPQTAQAAVKNPRVKMSDPYVDQHNRRLRDTRSRSPATRKSGQGRLSPPVVVDDERMTDLGQIFGQQTREASVLSTFVISTNVSFRVHLGWSWMTASAEPTQWRYTDVISLPVATSGDIAPLRRLERMTRRNLSHTGFAILIGNDGYRYSYLAYPSDDGGRSE